MATTSQWWFMHSSASLPQAGAEYYPVNGATEILKQSADVRSRSPVSAAGNLLTIYVKLTVAPGVGTSYRFQLMLNGAASGVLDVTISGTNTSGSASGTVAIVAGDLVSIRCTPTGGPALSRAQVSLEFDPTTASNFCYPNTFASGANQSAPTVPKYSRLFGGNRTEHTVSPTFAQGSQDIAPFAGTITAHYVNLATAPGAGNSWTFILTKNGTEEATSSITVSGTNTAGNVTGLSIAVVAGDILVWKVSAATTPTATRGMAWSTTFVPTTAGRFVISGVVGSGSFDNAAVNYADFTGEEAASATEANVQFIRSPGTINLAGLTVGLDAVAGAAKTWDLQLRKNTADGNLHVTIGGVSDLTISDAAHSDALSADDILDIRSTPTGSPTITGHGWAWAASTGSIPSGGGGGSTGGKKGGGKKGGGKGGPPSAQPSAPSGSFRVTWSTSRKDWS